MHVDVGVVVSHWGVLQALTGEDFDNCELMIVKLSGLKVPAWTPANAAGTKCQMDAQAVSLG
jgi:hypothetical protein